MNLAQIEGEAKTILANLADLLTHFGERLNGRRSPAAAHDVRDRLQCLLDRVFLFGAKILGFCIA